MSVKNKPNQGKDHRAKIGCQSCGHSWIPRTTSPKYCPQCRKRLSWPTPKEPAPKDTRGKWGTKIKEWLPYVDTAIRIIRSLLKLAEFGGW